MFYNCLNTLDSGFRRNDGKTGFMTSYGTVKIDDPAKNPPIRHPGESRGPELLDVTGFRLSPE
jgi:hypothetical protein